MATLDANLLAMARPALAEAKKRGVKIMVFTAGANMDEWKEFAHYASIEDVGNIAPTALTERMRAILSNEDVQAAGWNPEQITIVTADDTDSIAVFKPLDSHQRMWALRACMPLIVIFQRQVITALLSEVTRFLAATSD